MRLYACAKEICPQRHEWCRHKLTLMKRELCIARSDVIRGVSESEIGKFFGRTRCAINVNIKNAQANLAKYGKELEKEFIEN